jgi:tartrate dehydratase alpha subunit/fumarate hydratase class I-like protein
MVLPGCQDTGTATVMGKRGQYVLTNGRDEEALSKGVFRAYTETNLRYSQVHTRRHTHTHMHMHVGVHGGMPSIQHGSSPMQV